MKLQIASDKLLVFDFLSHPKGRCTDKRLVSRYGNSSTGLELACHPDRLKRYVCCSLSGQWAGYVPKRLSTNLQGSSSLN